VQYEAALFLNKFSMKNTLGTSVLKQICKLLQKPSTVDVRTQEELLACLQNTFSRSKVSWEVECDFIAFEVLNTMDDLLPNPCSKIVTTSVKLMCDIVAFIEKNNLLNRFGNSDRLIYSILMKLSFFQDSTVVLTSLKLIEKVFNTLTRYRTNPASSIFFSTVMEKGILNRLYCLLIQYENDASNQAMLLNVLSCITFGDLYACKSVVEFGFLHIVLRLLQNANDLFSKHENVYRELCIIIKHILRKSELHHVMIDFGIVPHIIKLCLEKKSTGIVPTFTPSLFPFCEKYMNFETFSSYRDLNCFQLRVHLILKGVKDHDDSFSSFSEQTIFSMINFQAF
jgi:hypothetical protein